MSLPILVAGIIVLGFFFGLAYFRLFRKPRQLQKLWDQIQAGDTRGPMRHLKTTIVKHGGSVDAHFLLAECYRREDNCQMAVVEYRYCLRLNKKPYLTTLKGIREGLVDCLTRLNKTEEALSELVELVKLDPKDYRYLFETANLFYNLGNLEQAATYFDKTININPTHAPSLTYLGVIMFHANQIKEAVVYLTRAVKYDTRNYMAYYYLGRIYMEGKDYPTAIKYFEASQRSPKYKIRAFIQKGGCYRHMHETENAINEYKKAITSSAGKDQNLHLAAKYALASLYESRGKLAEAIQQWEDIYRINPSYKDVPKKLDQYQDLRTDDNMKDFLVSPVPVFEGICLDLVKHLGYQIVDIKHEKPSITNIIAAPNRQGMRNQKIQHIFIKIFRDAVSLGLTTVKNLLEEAKSQKCARAICISPLKFRPEAVEYSRARQIDLIDGNKLSRLLSEIR
ncbi:MAG: tetratricopeptide repeat protein [Spirochaetota bacterium]